MIVAITGGIGGGKSYVCRLLGERGIRVYDCDAAAKRLMRTSRTLQEQLSSLVGVDLFPGGQLQKPLLRQYLLQSRDHGRVIDDIVHPAVAEDFLLSSLIAALTSVSIPTMSSVSPRLLKPVWNE